MEVILTDGRFYSKKIDALFSQIDRKLIVISVRTEEELLSRACEAEAVITTSTPFSKHVINGLKKCKVIVRCGVGVDNIDLLAATKRSIFIANTPGFYVEEVSSHAIAMLFGLNRKTHVSDKLVRKGAYDFEKIRPISNLSGKWLGLIGYGRIGRAIFEKLKVFGVRCAAYDPYFKECLTPSSEVTFLDLRSLLKTSDFVSINCPLTPETAGLIGSKEMSLMKPTAYLINTARGGIIDESALLRALREGWIAGAGLDAFAEEPLQKNNPLLKIKNVIATPHIGWYSEESIEKMSEEACNEVCRVLSGERPKNLVNIESRN